MIWLFLILGIVYFIISFIYIGKRNTCKGCSFCHFALFYGFLVSPYYFVIDMFKHISLPSKKILMSQIKEYKNTINSIDKDNNNLKNKIMTLERKISDYENKINTYQKNRRIFGN